MKIKTPEQIIEDVYSGILGGEGNDILGDKLRVLKLQLKEYRDDHSFYRTTLGRRALEWAIKSKFDFHVFVDENNSIDIQELAFSHGVYWSGSDTSGVRNEDQPILDIKNQISGNGDSRKYMIKYSSAKSQEEYLDDRTGMLHLITATYEEIAERYISGVMAPAPEE